MKRFAPIALSLGALVAFSGVAFAAGDASKGKTLYNANCMACHGDAGNGQGPAAVALDPKPADFTAAAFWEGRTNDELKTVIRTGKPGTTMAPFPQLGDQDLDDVVAYLETFKSE